MTYDEFRKELFRLYVNKEYDAALNLLYREGSTFPEHAVRTLYWQASVEGVTGRLDQALASLQDLAGCGFWYAPEPVRADPDLTGLHERPEFEEILRLFAERHAQAQQESRPEMLVLAPDAGAAQPYPLLMALHGRNDNARNFAARWQTLLAAGWLVALPQPSLILASESYGWDDRETSITELKAQFNNLVNRYPIDPQRIVLAGFSQGGGLSVLLTVTQEIPVTAFIALAPYLHGVEELNIQAAESAAQAQGLLITGDQDPGQKMFEHFETLLQTTGMAYERRSYPELGHDVPADFPAVLDEIIDKWFGTRPAN